MKRPIVGITASLNTYKQGPFTGQNKLILNSNYIDAITTVGAIPMIIPIVEELEIQKRQLKLIDALLLTGGDDLQPHLYGEEPHPALGTTTPARDHYELSLLHQAFALGLPILGICRGLQLINVAFGGTLYQDLPEQYPLKDLLHSQDPPPHTATHPVSLVVGTRLQTIFNEKELQANSLHHQAIRNLAPGFLVNAYANDGIIEGIEMDSHAFVLGVQWHPEQMLSTMLPIFQAFCSLRSQ